MNLATQSSASSADEIRESGRAFQSLIVWGEEATFINICICNGSLKCHRVLIFSTPSFGDKVICWSSCVSVWVCFVPTMPDVGSRYSKFGFEKKKKKLHLVLKKKCWGRIPGVPSLRQEESVSMNARLRWRGWGEALRLFYGKHVLAILKTRSTRLELRNYSRIFTNL